MNINKIGKTQRFLLKTICTNIALSYYTKGRYQFWWDINSYLYKYSPLKLDIIYTEFKNPTVDGQVGEINVYWEKLLIAQISKYSTYLRFGDHIRQNSHFHLLEYTLDFNEGL
jgi:hypothetical protein